MCKGLTSLMSSEVNNPPAKAGTQFNTRSRKIPHVMEQQSPCSVTTELAL